MATFSRLFKPPLPPFLPTLLCPTQRLKGNSGVTLRCSGCEQSSPFMHADMGRREEVDEGGVKWRDGAKGGVAVGRRSRLSFQCEEGEGELRRTLSDVQTTESSVTHTYSTRLSVFMYSVQSWKDPGGKHVRESRYRFPLKPHAEHSRALQILNNWFITHYNYIWGFTPAVQIDDEYNSLRKCHERDYVTLKRISILKKVKYNSGCLVYDPFLLQDAAFVSSLESGLKGFLAFIYRSF